MINDKKSKILIGCLALLLVMAVGYALFSETITINGTATAKGDFSIETSCTPGISSDLYVGDFTYEEYWDYDNPSDFLANYPEGAYKNDSCNVTDNKVFFETEFSMPTARRYFTVKITNKGSIPIFLDFGTIVDNTTVEAVVTEDNGTTKTLTTKDFVTISKYARYYGIATNSTTVNFSESDNLNLETGESLYLVIGLAFPEKLEHSADVGGYTDYLTFAKSVELKIDYELTLPFKQVTAD